jgi:hypothetical protein
VEEIPSILSSTTMEERERRARASWRRRGLYIGPSKSNRYLLFLPKWYYRFWKRYYRSEFESPLNLSTFGMRCVIVLSFASFPNMPPTS